MNPQKAIALIDVQSATQEAFEEAIKKYDSMFSVKIDFVRATNVNGLGRVLDTGKKFDMVFINKTLDLAELNMFLATYLKLKTEPPVLVVNTPPDKYINAKFTKERIVPNAILSKDFVFDCLRLYLGIDTSHKIDPRIFREILLGVVDAISQNTGEKLTPAGISQTKSESEVQDVTSVLAFYGEGIKGTLNVRTSLPLLKIFAMKMLKFEEKDLTNDILDDVMGEMANQILGIARNALGTYGYELNSSMALVVTGKDHFFHASSTGHYYLLPFSYNNELKFDVTFCYDTYPIKLARKAALKLSAKRVMDVRLSNDIINNVRNTIAANAKIQSTPGVPFSHKAKSYRTQTLHVMHGRGEQGGFLACLDVPMDTAKSIVKAMLFCDDAGVNNAAVADAIGELVNQIQGTQKKTSQNHGYTFMNIFHCSFIGKDEIQYLLKNQGSYFRVRYVTSEKQPFTLCYGVDSSFAEKLWDISEYVHSLPAEEP